MKPSSPIIRGLWQLSQGHQNPSATTSLIDSIKDSIECGFTTFDCADIYTGVEELLGDIKSSMPSCPLRIHTKYVPDLSALSTLNYDYTAQIIERSLRRLRTDSIDLVQFHWWDYQQPRYLEALDHLSRLKGEGKIKGIGLTNFDTTRVKEILTAGFKVESIQVQASLLDKRAQNQMQTLCHANGIQRLAYGTLLGGFLSATWLNRTEPSLEELPNRSLMKYKLLIEDWGGWERFQGLLKLLSDFSKKYEASLSQIAIQAVLQGGLAEATIVGLSRQNYSAQNRQLKQHIPLEKGDLEQLLSWHSPLQGDVYELERLPRHGSLMRTNLNRKDSSRTPL